MANAPLACPPRIRTDASNAFAHHSMAVRVPAILDGVLRDNPEFSPAVSAAVAELRDAITENRELPSLEPSAPYADEWRAGLAARPEARWLAVDWFFAETYAYRQLIERVRYFATRRDPFLPTKREEYASPGHAEALEQALSIEALPEERLFALFGAALFGNRMDLSFAASRVRGTSADREDLLLDDREPATTLVLHGSGPIHVIADNAGTELTLDLVLVDAFLELCDADVIVHVKVHPTFVSDAILEDVLGFLGLGQTGRFEPNLPPRGEALRERLRDAVTTGRLTVTPHAYWNGPLSLWDMPRELEEAFAAARLVVLKGDANYRRAVGDALWPPETSFSSITSYFPAPLLALRTLKSDPISGLPPGTAEALDAADPTWRVNGRRGIASLGGSHAV